MTAVPDICEPLCRCRESKPYTLEGNLAFSTTEVPLKHTCSPLTNITEIIKFNCELDGFRKPKVLVVQKFGLVCSGASGDM